MLNLLKAEWIKLRKDKIIWIVVPIIIGFAILNSLLSSVLETLLETEPIEGLNISFTGKALFFNSFNPSQNIGLVIPILICIFVAREFTYGTIRNKLIAGYKKRDIYLSITVSSLIIGAFFVIIYALANLLFGSMVVGYGEAITAKEVLNIIKALAIGTFVYTFFFTSLSVLVSFVIRSLGLAIFISIVISLACTGLAASAELLSSNAFLKQLVNFIPTYPLIKLDGMSGWLILKSFLSTIVFTLLFAVLGIFSFTKRDVN